MVDPLDPNLQPGRQNRPDDPVRDPPRPVGRSGSTGYVMGAILLAVIVIAGYYLYSSGDMANAPAPPEPAAPTAPAPTQ
ncbi:hypothetical protein DUT91_18510 [Phyllobacterium salinisoli]|uniref:Uncharacterized protein n=1 Tax=Phyllobacterium salinisoli TaxID=1899321 RepID=A0A368K1W7_9HYPH|nr:hypothetical protein [Phyllobacterium salinisoli]RCS22392.1 hypothetical protein DUT91_18510 [Phyllobacterium salinisoli]